MNVSEELAAPFFRIRVRKRIEDGKDFYIIYNKDSCIWKTVR
jgi:hypothetical protein